MAELADALRFCSFQPNMSVIFNLTFFVIYLVTLKNLFIGCLRVLQTCRVMKVAINPVRIRDKFGHHFSFSKHTRFSSLH